MIDDYFEGICDFVVERSSNPIVSIVLMSLIVIITSVIAVLNYIEVTNMSCCYLFAVGALCFCAIVFESIICCNSIWEALLRIFIITLVTGVVSFVAAFLSMLLVFLAGCYLMYLIFTGNLSMAFDSLKESSSSSSNNWVGKISVNGEFGFRSLRKDGADFIDDLGDRWREGLGGIFERLK